MSNNITLCDNCAGKIVLSLEEHTIRKGLCFCSEECADTYYTQETKDQYPSGLAHDLGLEEGGY